MMKNMRAVLAGLAMAIIVQPAMANPADAKKIVDEFHQTLLASMKEARKTGFAGRKAKLDPVIRSRFDLALMTRAVVGPAWATLNPADQSAISSAFANWAVASYAGRFNDFDGEQFITGDTADGGRGTLQVKSQIKPREDKPTQLTYRLKNDGKSWRIVDVYLDGSISQLASWRAEFGAVMQKQGAAGLVSRLNQLTADFGKKG
jgi:phospholipid transport system substrate-binding protein